MCTLALAWNVFPDVPVVARANRDEALDRESEPPTLRDGGEHHPAVVTPRDRQAGGTWVGLTEHGLYVTITNRWVDDPPPADRSRGLLVRDCLRERTAESAARFLEEELAARSYDGFNLVLADDTAAFVVSWDGHLGITQLEPGVHVLSNVGGVLNDRETFDLPDSRSARGREQADRVRRLHRQLTPEPGERPVAWDDRAADAFTDHDLGACIHGDGYGTRSSSIVMTGESPTFAFVDGPPCETAATQVRLPADWPRPVPDESGPTEGHI